MELLIYSTGTFSKGSDTDSEPRTKKSPFYPNPNQMI
jgi:hypothetical protein